MEEAIRAHRVHFASRKFVISVLVGVFLVLLALVVNYFAGTYATEKASSSVTDIILSNTKAYDVDELFVYGTWLFYLITVSIGIYRPERLPFALKASALLVFIRSIFITLTHIGPFPTHTIVSPLSWINYFTFGGDLFFSAHTAIPFLFALMCWQNKPFRIFFLAASGFFAAVVLLGHLHYSIDVLAAFFITYTVFNMAKYFWKDDWQLFQKGI